MRNAVEVPSLPRIDRGLLYECYEGVDSEFGDLNSPRLLWKSA